MTPTMTNTTTAARDMFLLSSPEGGPPPAPSVHASESGESWLYSGVPVFRSGTFRNSFGEERSWDRSHLEQMVSNFELLSRLGKLESIPVRADHPGLFEGGSVEKIIGYVTGLSIDHRQVEATGESFDFLIADYEILDPVAQDKISRGLWRNRSAEIGRYITNSPEAEYFPVLMGFAYVDFSAVEHLNGFSRASGEPHDHFAYTEGSMSRTTTDQGTSQPPAAPAATEQHGAPKAAEAHSFTIGGERTSDFAAVQAHITRLEADNHSLAEFRAAALESERVDYVKSLADSGRILASQVEPMTELAKALTADQFKSFRDVHDLAAPSPILGQHGRDRQQRPDSDESAEDQVSVLRETVSLWKRTGAMSDSAIKATSTYTQLIAADPAFVL